MRFWIVSVWVGYGLVRVNQFLVKYACHAKISNYVENFGSGMVQFVSIRISGPLLDEPISDGGSSMNPDCSVQVSGLGSRVGFVILSDLVKSEMENFHLFCVKKRGEILT